MEYYIKIFYDCLYFQEAATEFSKSLAPLQVEMIYLLDSDREKKDWSRSIYFCFGLDKWMDLPNLPPKFVVMQLEPLCVRGFLSENYITICSRSLAIFEYSKQNLKVYREYNIPKSKVFLFHVGFSENKPNTGKTDTKLSTKTMKDIDILFIGKATPYRASVIQLLKKKYPTKIIQHYQDLWGTARDSVVQRSKIALNIHSEKNSLFPLETPRLLHLSNHDIHIVSEISGDLDEDNRWSERVIFVDKDWDALGELLLVSDASDDAAPPSKKSKRRGNPPKMIHQFKILLEKQNIRVTDVIRLPLPVEEIQKLRSKWFDTDSTMFETIDLGHPSIPDFSTFPERLLPMVSIMTLTTLERLHRWIDLMIWNNKHRVYDPHKLEWIIVVERPSGREQVKRFDKLQARLLSSRVIPRFVYYDNRNADVCFRVTEKRNLGIQNCLHEIIDIMDDDDIEIPDALRVKTILLDHYENKKCVGSKSFMCLDITQNNLFVKRASFPTESTLTFQKSFASVGFTPSIHGEGSLMVLSQAEQVIDIPSALNLIAITHKKNITGSARTMPVNCLQESDQSLTMAHHVSNLSMYLESFVGSTAAAELSSIIFFG